MNAKIGEIYIISFPFTDGTRNKKRPCLIINEDRKDFEVLFITTQKNNHIFPLSKTDYKNGGLSIDSYVRLNKGLLFSKKLFGKEHYVGTLTQSSLKNIFKQIVINYSNTYLKEYLPCIQKCLH